MPFRHHDLTLPTDLPMTPRRPVRSLLLLAALIAGGAQLPAAALDNLTVVAVTDMTPAGRALPPVSPDTPMYYQAVTTGFQDFGRSIAGEREPPNDAFLQTVLRTLKKQGYLPATDAHAPTIVLGFSWGSVRESFGGALRVLGGDKLNLDWEAKPTLGLQPGVWLRGLRSEKAERVMELAQGDLFVMNIAAYDRPALIAGKLVPLWQTRISSPARGVWAADALPRIVEVAGPVIGRETDTPELTTVAEAFGREGDVQIGELKVVEEDFDLEHLPVLDLTKEKTTP